MTAVTIGLPFKDDKRTLLAAIASVFAQTCPDWHLLLVDDGSRDGALDLARSIRDARVSVISDGENHGLPARLNQIAMSADSEFVARMDADDVMVPERIEVQLAALRRRPAVDLIASAAYAIDDGLRVYGIRNTGPLPARHLDYLKNAVLLHPTIMARRRWYLANPYDPAFRRAQDKELWLRTYPWSRWDSLERPLLFKREDGTVVRRHYSSSCAADRAVLRRHHGVFPSKVAFRSAVCRSYAKQSLYTVLGASPLQQRLVRGRAEDLDAEHRMRAQAILDGVLATDVPRDEGHALAASGRVEAG